MTPKIVPFLDVFKDVSGGNAKTPQSEFLTEGDIPVVDQGQRLIAGYVIDKSRVCKAKPPVIVFGDHTRIIKYVDFQFAMGADGTKVLAPRNGNDPKYLFHALQAIPIPSAGYSRHYKFLKETEIPLPPLAEQKRIAGILDAADALRAKRRETLAQLHSLLQATFLDLFGDPTTNVKAWERCELEKLGAITTGRTPPTKNDGMFGGNIPFATPGDLDLGLESTARTVTPEGAKLSKLVRAGSALVGCIGTIGKMAVARSQTAFNQQINAVEWGKRIEDVFGIAALSYAVPQMLSKASSTTVPILNKTSFSAVTIIVPPIDLQRRFSCVVRFIDQQTAVQRFHLAELDALFASLQSRAFRGEL